MLISQVSKKPALIKMDLDDPKIVETYGETITFYMYDNVDLNTYFNFFKVQQSEDGTELNKLIRKIVLNEAGEQAVKDDEMLPVDICFAALVKINDTLGKSKAISSTPVTGTQQD
jgi:hypothetical protein